MFPVEFHPRIEVIFDGVDTRLWRRREGVPRYVGDTAIDARTRIVTYVSRGLEWVRGFDIFMRVARRIYEAYPDVVFVVIGGDKSVYADHARSSSDSSTLKEHVVRRDDYDLSRFLFTGWLSRLRLAELLSLSDLHVYLTVPTVLSWSVFDALACECVLLASDTAPVREVIRHGENGLLCDFSDIDRFARQGVAVLRDPCAYRPLRDAAVATVHEAYSLDCCLPPLAAFYSGVRRRLEGVWV